MLYLTVETGDKVVINAANGEEITIEFTRNTKTGGQLGVEAAKHVKVNTVFADPNKQYKNKRSKGASDEDASNARRVDGNR